MSNESCIVSKVWSFVNILRDDGVGYGDYLEQLTYQGLTGGFNWGFNCKLTGVIKL